MARCEAAGRMETLRFRFEQREDDLIAYNLLFMSNSTSQRRGFWLARLTLPAVAILLAAYTLLVRPERLGGTLVISVLAVAWFLWWPSFRRASAAGLVRRLVRERSNAAYLGEHTVTIDDETIRCEYPGGRSEVRWSGIVDRLEDDRLLLLYQSSFPVLLFPKDRIEPAVIDAIRQRAQQEIAKAKPAG